MKPRIIKMLCPLMVMAIVCQGSAFADEAQLMTMMKELQSTMKTMQKTIDLQADEIRQLKTRSPQVSMAAPAGEASQAAPMSDYDFNNMLDTATGGAQKWLKNLSFKGDFRLRYEAFQNTSGALTENDDRNRFRYRLRFGFEKKFSEEIKVGFGLASGESPTVASATTGGGTAQSDPTSTNTTFDNNFNFKSIYIEKAYASYTPSFLKNRGMLKQVNITAGKHSNPFEQGSSDIIWDRDVRPEGVYEKADFNLLDTADVDLTGYLLAGQYILDEDSSSAISAGDAELFAHQIGLSAIAYTPLFERPVEWNSAVSYYSYNDYATNGNFTIGGVSLARGNSNVVGPATDLDAQDFEVLEIYNELAFTPYGVPFRPFFDWAVNLNSDLTPGGVTGGVGSDEQNAWAMGLKIGNILAKGDWEVSGAYKRIDANAVPGFNDSDFGYSGHSGGRGMVFKAGYALTDNMFLNGAAFFVNNLNTGTSTVIDQEQRRFQLDLVWKF